MEYQEGDAVLCTVTKIVGTTVFANIEGAGEGSIILSEIAAGRIKNIREYVVPNKKIACKILRIQGDRIDLSLRRVSEKERKEVMEQYKKEKNAETLIRAIAGEASAKIIESIKKTGSLADFLQKARDNPALLADFFTEEQAAKIDKALAEKKEKLVELKKEFSLSCIQPDGIKRIREILKDDRIKYIAASKFTITIKARDFKQVNAEMNRVISQIEKSAKEKQCEFSVKE